VKNVESDTWVVGIEENFISSNQIDKVFVPIAYL
jgi:hypothetical protein